VLFEEDEVHAVSLAARPLGALSIDGAPQHIRWLAKSRSAELVIQETATEPSFRGLPGV
jgi:hypothetical protein